MRQKCTHLLKYIVSILVALPWVIMQSLKKISIDRKHDDRFQNYIEQ